MHKMSQQLHESMYLNNSLCVYDDSNKKKFAFISSGDLEHETLEKSCHLVPKNKPKNSEFAYIDRLRGVEVCITIH